MFTYFILSVKQKIPFCCFDGMKQLNKNNSVAINFHSGIYTLKTEHMLPVSLEKAWDYFSNPENLSTITPAEMNFRITSGIPGKMFAGQIISYTVNVLPFIKSNWVTEITQVKNLSYFIDEQRFGPYRMWHHEHHFTESEKGIRMTDKVTYKIPFGIFGRLAHFLFIRKKLAHIFDYRAAMLDKLFAK